MDLITIAEADLRPELDQAIRDGLCACFPASAAVFSRTRAWHGSGPAFSVVAREGAIVLAHVGVVERTIRAGAEMLRIAGVQNVFVRPERRGSGWVDRVLAAAMAEARRRERDLGVLFCAPRVVKVYARCGWALATPRTVWATNSAGVRYLLPEKNVMMTYALRKAGLADGPVDLGGDDW